VFDSIGSGGSGTDNSAPLGGSFGDILASGGSGPSLFEMFMPAPDRMDDGPDEPRDDPTGGAADMTDVDIGGESRRSEFFEDQQEGDDPEYAPGSTR
jgi:hypothetical protein